MKTVRLFKGKDVDMLSAASAIIENAIAHKNELIAKRPSWADPFLPDIQNRIKNAFSVYLGIDNAKNQREATAAVVAIQKQAVKKLAEFKVQLMEDFKKNKIRRDELLKQLGFTVHLKKTQTGDQESLIELLYQFKTNMTKSVIQEITNAGTPDVLINEITGFADTLKSANVNQEFLKAARKEVTAAGVKELNDIYEEVISVAKISAKLFADKPAVKEEFSFSKIKKALNNKATKTPAKPEEKK